VRLNLPVIASSGYYSRPAAAAEVSSVTSSDPVRCAVSCAAQLVEQLDTAPVFDVHDVYDVSSLYDTTMLVDNDVEYDEDKILYVDYDGYDSDSDDPEECEIEGDLSVEYDYDKNEYVEVEYEGYDYCDDKSDPDCDEECELDDSDDCEDVYLNTGRACSANVSSDAMTRAGPETIGAALTIAETDWPSTAGTVNRCAVLNREIVNLLPRQGEQMVNDTLGSLTVSPDAEVTVNRSDRTRLPGYPDNRTVVNWIPETGYPYNSR
jgi:hypothetical protein